MQVAAFGLDYGYTNHPSAFVAQFYSPSERRFISGMSFTRNGLVIERSMNALLSWDTARRKL